MVFTSRGMYAEVDLGMFRRALRRSQMSYQQLADEATRELRKIARSEKRKRRDDSVPTGISKALVGQLAVGKARATHELRGIAIERALAVADGDLFVPKVVHGTRAAKRSA